MSGGARPRALVVDDSRAMRSILRRILVDVGFETVDAADGRDALAQLSTLGPVDLVLVDWNMPVMDGLALVRAVRADRTYDGVKLMMVTTESESARMGEALAAGANEYLMKPFDADAVRSKMELLGLDVRRDRP